MLTDPNVKVILVNIFAGINRCDWIAQGVVQATRDQQIGVPVIARLAGTNVEEGRRILTDSGLAVIQADDLDDAAAKAVAAVAGVRGMSVFVDKESKVIIQGFTGQHATFHAEESMRFGTKVVGRRDAGQGRHDASRIAGVQLASPRRSRRPARR